MRRVRGASAIAAQGLPDSPALRLAGALAKRHDRVDAMLRWRKEDWRAQDETGAAAQGAPLGARLGATLVWDLFVRAFHWSLVAAVAVAAVTGFLLDSPWIAWHVWGGAAAAALVAARVVWGFTGPTHARFADFVTGPRAALAHLRELRHGHGQRHRGHNPLGALMVLGLLTVTALIALTGAITLGGVFKTGPLGFAVSYALGDTAKDVHNILAITMLAMIALHVGGVIFESRRARENLARAMIDGRKQARPGDAPVARVAARPVIALALGAMILGGGTALALTLAQRPGFGAAVASLDPVYAEECGACHLPHNPSLLPRASWALLMAGLDEHFGENAALDADTTAEIAAWLDAHAAESADTKASHRLRNVDLARPFQITASPWWTRKHRAIADATFASRAVGGKGQCAACHGDGAAGRFYPANISIPKETTL